MEDASPRQPDRPQRAPFDAFADLTRRLMAVPKPEIDRAEAEYQLSREGKPKPGPRKGAKDK